MQNADVARIFDDLADLLEIQGANPFRVRAYRNASRTIESLSDSLADIAADDSRSLDDLPGMDELANQVLVTAEVPSSVTAAEATVAVTLGSDQGDLSAEAFVPIQDTSPEGPVTAGVDEPMMLNSTYLYAGLGALAVGLLIVLVMAAPKKQKPLTGAELASTYASRVGGVHKGAEESFDISADLQELARTPVAVICAGAKSILDLRLTLEYLETHGVPVVGYRCDEFPAFFTRGSGLPVDVRLDAAAALVQHAEPHHARGVAKVGRLLVPHRRLGVVDLHADAARIHPRQIDHGRHMAGLGGAREQACSLERVLVGDPALDQDVPQPVHGLGMVA